MPRDKRECCDNCKYYSRMWNFCGNANAKACKDGDWCGALNWCVYWKKRAEDGN